jgi:hypothetical protein
MAAHRPSFVLFLLAVVVVLASGAEAQSIALRTVPVATGDQFLVHPSRNLGLGGVSIALDDPWLDPFLNPALGREIGASTFLTSPTFYGVEHEGGAGRTIPLAGLFRGRDWFGGASAALQQIVDQSAAGACCWAPRPEMSFIDIAFPPAVDGTDATNTYASGYVGRRLGERWTLGLGGSVARLNAVDGVDLLYANARSIEQDGSAWDLRAGATAELGEGRRLETALVYSRFAMEHDVTYLDWRWDPAMRIMEPTARVEENLDRTNSAGLHSVFTAPIGDGWRAGTVVTVNRKSHPKIPNYDLANIPRDPGDSWAFNLGAGLGHERGPLRFGVDVVYEPVWSETWAEAADTVRTAGGVLLQPGDHTVENDFFLSNLHLRLGLGRETRRWGFQLGLQAAARETELEQWNVVTAIRRDQHESWMEWTPSLGAVVKFPEVEVRYAGWIATGTGTPAVDFGPRGARANAAETAADFLVAPAGPLVLQEAHVTSHQITVRLPLD